MHFADLKLDLLHRIEAIDSDKELLIILDAVGRALEAHRLPPMMAREDAPQVYTARADADEAAELVPPDLDEVLGYRPNGEPVTLRKALPEWEAALQEVLDGGGYSIEEVLQMLDDEFGPE